MASSAKRRSQPLRRSARTGMFIPPPRRRAAPLFERFPEEQKSLREVIADFEKLEKAAEAVKEALITISERPEEGSLGADDLAQVQGLMDKLEAFSDLILAVAPSKWWAAIEDHCCKSEIPASG